MAFASACNDHLDPQRGPPDVRAETRPESARAARPSSPHRADDPAIGRRGPGVDGSRPLKCPRSHELVEARLVVLVVPPVVMVVLLQILLYQVVGVIEGSDDPMAPTSPR